MSGYAGNFTYIYWADDCWHLAGDFCVGPARKSYHCSDILNSLMAKLVRNVSKQIFVNVDFKCVELYIVSLFVQAGCSVC